MIVATAGHVDHGKTSLVKALTQVDTDRLPEERRRGMSIDLGFAYADLGGAAPIGFVDVPGHERFVANMLAGVACIDLGLLVVAADDGPMPQTREHLAILALLGVPDCVVALTKVDRVDAGRRAAAEAAVRALLLAASPYRGSRVFPVDAIRGDGVPALADALARAAGACAARPATGRFRMAIDRSFLVPGAGRVVTGAVLAGTLRPGDAVVLAPGGTPLRVRGLQTRHRSAAAAVAGERCAVNLAGARPKDAEPVRGDWLVAPRAHAPTDRLDVRLDVLAGGSRALGHGSRLQLHLGAAAVPARLELADRGVIELGASGWAQLALARPVAALHGDRFILRDPAAGRTVAGGSVVDPFPPIRRRPTVSRAAELEALETTDAAVALQRLLGVATEGVDLRRYALARNLDDADATALERLDGLVLVGGALALADAPWQAARARVRDALARAHAAEPERIGPTEGELLRAAEKDRGPALDRAGEEPVEREGAASRARPGASVGRRAGDTGTRVLAAALDRLLAEGWVVRDGLRVRLTSHRAVLRPADADRLVRVEAVLAPAGLRPPIVGELAAALGLALPDLLDFLARASHLGAMVRVAPNRYFLPRTVVALAAQARRLADESAGAGFDAAAFRDRTGIGRNLTVQVLEFLDREGVTRFDGRRRQLPSPVAGDRRAGASTTG